MPYHVPDRLAAAQELRRVLLRPGGTCVALTNGRDHTKALTDLVEATVRRSTQGWVMRNPSTRVFSLDNGAAQLGVAFDSVTCVRPDYVAPVVVRDAATVAGYVASVADHYQHEVDRPWSEVVDDVRAAVEAVIDAHGSFTVTGDPGAFICR